MPPAAPPTGIPVPAPPTGIPVPAPPAGIPAAEVEIDEPGVRELLRAQHPDLAALPLTHVATGWDNTTYRLGDEFAVRLPRISAAVDLLRKEQQWLPVLAPRLPVPVPVPVRRGEPGPGFPWPWSVVRWVPGRSAEHESLSPGEAALFGRLLAAVHRPAPPDAPRNDYRGVPLETRDEMVLSRIDRLAGTATAADVPLAAVRDRWRRVSSVPRDVEETWIHGDLHPKNLVVDGGRLAAVLDWGDMTVGDPATDLAAAWMLFPTAAHARVWDGYGSVSAATLLRAEGWALLFGVVLLDTGLSNDPPFARIGRLTLDRLVGDGTD